MKKVVQKILIATSAIILQHEKIQNLESEINREKQRDIAESLKTTDLKQLYEIMEYVLEDCAAIHQSIINLGIYEEIYSSIELSKVQKQVMNSFEEIVKAQMQKMLDFGTDIDLKMHIEKAYKMYLNLKKLDIHEEAFSMT